MKTSNTPHKELQRRVNRLIALREEYRRTDPTVRPLTRVMAWRIVRLAVNTASYMSQ